MNFCGNCGQKLDRDAKFCPNCGKNLTNINQTESANPEPEKEIQNTRQNVTQPVQINSTPVQKPSDVNTPVKSTAEKTGGKKIKKGLLSGIAVFIILAAGLFFIYKLFLSGPSKMTADYKVPEKNKIIKLENGGLAPANMFFVILKDDFGKKDAEDIAKIVGGKVVGEIELNNLFQIEFDGKSKEDLYSAIDKVKTNNKVLIASPDAALEYEGAENSSCNPLDDPFYEGDNGKVYEMIHLKKAWDIIKASGVKLNDVIVGVVDTEIDYSSDELNGGKSLIVPLGRKDMSDKKELTHGGMVTSIIAANGDNGGMSGFASPILGDHLQVNTIANVDPLGYQQVDDDKINPEDITQVRLHLDFVTRTYTLNAFQNIQKQIDNGATVINCSFSNHLNDYTSDENRRLSYAFKTFLEKAQVKYPNVIFVGTAGNDGNVQLNNNKIWGKKSDNLVTVGALDVNGNKTNYTNLAAKNGDNEVTVVACGDMKVENGKTLGGTSFVAPQITGLISMLRSINPKLTPAEIKKILTETSKDVSAGQNNMMNLIQADDAVLKAIEMATGKKFDKDKLLAMMNVDLKSDGASPEFKITATLTSVGEKGTMLEIECTGGDYGLSGDRRKELSSAGSVSWSLSIPKPETILSVKVTRLDTKSCRTILVGGKIEAKDLVGNWDGGVCWDSWSTPYKIAEPKIREKLISGKGEYLPMTMVMTLASENVLSTSMDVKGATIPPPPLSFSFNDGNLEAGTTYMLTKHTYSGKVKVEGGKYVITGEWAGSNNGLTMNGRWKATKPIKQN